MKARVGNTVTFVEDLYSDPYSFVPALELFDEMQALGISSGDMKFGLALKEATGEIIRVSGTEHICVKVTLFSHELELWLLSHEVKLTVESIDSNNRQDALAKLEKQEKAGQMRLF